MNAVVSDTEEAISTEATSGAGLEEASENQEEIASSPHSLPRCYPHWRGKPVYHGNKEALGWALDAIGRAVSFIGAGAFLSTALLKLAKQAAGCETEPPPGSTTIPECNARVYGIRPSSLLTTYTIVVGVLSSALMPFMGAIVDYTSHRRLVGRICSVLFCVLLFPQIFINQDTWFAVAVLQIGVAFIGWAQTMVTYAYLPELTNSEKRLNSYTQSFTVLSFGSMVIYLACLVGITTAAGLANDAVASAKLAMSVSFTVSSITLYIAWGRLLQRRSAAHEIPQGQKLWSAGFIQVYHTSINIYKNLSALKWFYVSISLIDAAINSLATVAITYLTDTLAFTSQENGIAVLVMLIGSVPGAFAAGYVTTKLNPIRSSMLATAILALNTIVVSIVLKHPGQQVATYVLAAGWGLGTGWKWTTDRLVASSIIPPGQDAELMGVYLFAGQILTWLPPLIFTTLNEAGVSQNVGIGTLAVYFVLGILALCKMGSYKAAVEIAGRVRPDLETQEKGTGNEVTDSVSPLNGTSLFEIGLTDRDR